MKKPALDKDGSGRYLPYPTMPSFCPDHCRKESCLTIECVTGRHLDKCAADDGCHLYLWVTSHRLPEALELLKRWGFRYECPLVWVKSGGPAGFTWQYNAELCLFARKGHLALQQKGIKTAFEAPRGRYSEKPDLLYEMAEKASPGPRLEMYARGGRKGWTVWGDEAGAA
jgi:N6-adenosine-specific RNA methylase IME4